MPRRSGRTRGLNPLVTAEIARPLSTEQSTGMGDLQELAQAAGCHGGKLTEVTQFSDLLILAIPLKAIWQLEPSLFEGKIVLDANNYYPA